MRNEEIKSEVAALRAEVVALAAAREKAARVSGLTGSGLSLSKLTSLSPVVELAVHALKSRHDK